MDNGNDYSGNEFRRVPNIAGSLGFYYKALKNSYIASNLIYTGSKYNNNDNKVKIASNTIVNTKIR